MLRSLILMHKWRLSSSKTTTTASRTWEILTMNQIIIIIIFKLLQAVFQCKEITQPYMSNYCDFFRVIYTFAVTEYVYLV